MSPCCRHWTRLLKRLVVMLLPPGLWTRVGTTSRLGTQPSVPAQLLPSQGPVCATLRRKFARSTSVSHTVAYASTIRSYGLGLQPAAQEDINKSNIKLEAQVLLRQHYSYAPAHRVSAAQIAAPSHLLEWGHWHGRPSLRASARILRHAALVDGYPLNGLNPQQGIERLIGPSNAQVVGALQSLALEYVSIYRWKPTPFMAELFLDRRPPSMQHPKWGLKACLRKSQTPYLAGRRGEEAQSRYSHWLDIFLEDLGTRGLPIPLSPLVLGLLAKDGSRSLVGAQQQRRGGWQRWGGGGSLIYGSMPESVENGQKKKREKQFQKRKRGEGGGGGKGFDGA
ncbi:hypothetical protein FA13DRAFT_1713843 [Coprinellus micaceus]|uniref:RNase III domain-containing protein n=1 Tax=Coprinellus micaceus TaxID=71717 RepID=A0A4Y7SUP6_COPMI|nr:hypothetical protein FA13DRAFT_1713843 [Coprinellus micaceus]